MPSKKLCHLFILFYIEGVGIEGFPTSHKFARTVHCARGDEPIGSGSHSAQVCRSWGIRDGLIFYVRVILSTMGQTRPFHFICLVYFVRCGSILL